MNTPHGPEESERLRRWRLALGEDLPGCGARGLSTTDRGVDRALSALYQDGDRRGGLGGSNPDINRWLGDIRRYFPASAVQIMQRDALEQLDLKAMLLEPELLAQVEPDVSLAAALLTLKEMIPEETRDTARRVVREVAARLERKLGRKLRQAVRGSVNRAARTRRPRQHEIDWRRTFEANLGNYLPEHGVIVPERLVGFKRARPSMQEIVLCVDQSGSMATSVVYSGICASVLASIRTIKTRLVCFDTEVVDLTDKLDDPVELLFGVQLGGGTMIARALDYCRKQITRPQKTTLVLISDLFEGGSPVGMFRMAATLKRSGVNMICLPALSDDGAPAYDDNHAAKFAKMGVPTFACTPDRFPDLMAAALERRDLNAWAAAEGIAAARG